MSRPIQKPGETVAFKLTTSGVDHGGIVSRVCRLLAGRGVNIVGMETRRVLSAESGTPLFEMDIDIEAPRAVSEEDLRKDLHRLADELVIDLVAAPRGGLRGALPASGSSGPGFPLSGSVGIGGLAARGHP